MVYESEATGVQQPLITISINSSPQPFGHLNEEALEQYELGNFVQAEALYRHELQGRTSLLGMCPATFISMNNLAMALSKLGEHEKASVFYLDCLVGLEALLEQDHEDILCVKCNLAATQYHLREIAKAERLYHEMERLRTSVRFSMRLDRTYTELKTVRESVFLEPDFGERPFIEDKSEHADTRSPKDEERIRVPDFPSDDFKDLSEDEERIRVPIFPSDDVKFMATTGTIEQVTMERTSILDGTPNRRLALHRSIAYPLHDVRTSIQLSKRPSSMSNMLGAFTGTDIGKSFPHRLKDAWTPTASTRSLSVVDSSRATKLGHRRTLSSRDFLTISLPSQVKPHAEYEDPRDPPPMPSNILPLPIIEYKNVGNPPPVPQPLQSLLGPGRTYPLNRLEDYTLEITRTSKSPWRRGQEGLLVEHETSRHRTSSEPPPMRSSQCGDASEKGDEPYRMPLESPTIQIIDITTHESRGFSVHSIITDRSLSISSQTLPSELDLEVFYADRRKLYPTRAILDTGADADFISETFRDLLGYDIDPEPYDGRSFIDASSNTFRPTSVVKIFFRWRQESSAENLMKRKFLVAPNLPPSVNMILGNAFIAQYEVLQFNGKFLPIRLTPLSEEQKAEVREKAEAARKANETMEAHRAEERRLKREMDRKEAAERLVGN